MFKDGGKEFKAMIDKLKASGAAITPEVAEATAQAVKFSQALDLAGMGLSNQFTTGFMDSLGGVDGFTKHMNELAPAAKWLGGEIGDVIKQFGILIGSIKDVSDWINVHILGKNDKENADKLNKVITDNHVYDGKVYTNPSSPWDHSNPDAVANADASGDKFADWAKGRAIAWGLMAPDVPTAFTPPASSIAASAGMSPAVSNTPYYQAPIINLTLPDIKNETSVNVNADEFNRVFDAKSTTYFDNGVRNMVLDLNSANSIN